MSFLHQSVLMPTSSLGILPPSNWLAIGSTSQCWEPRLATFSIGCINIIAFLPTLISAIVLIARYAFRPLWHRRPLWLRVFAAEEYSDNSDAEDEALLLNQKSWSSSATRLGLMLTFGMALGSISTIERRGQMFHLLLMPALPCLVSCIVLVLERPHTTPGAIFLIQSALLLAQLLILTSLPAGITWTSAILLAIEISISVFSISIMLVMPLRDPRLDGRPRYSPSQPPSSDLISPEHNFSLWDWMTVSWIAPVIAIGYKRPLREEDVWRLPLEFQHGRLHRLFRDIKGSVIARLLKANAPDLITITFLGILETVASMMQIVLLKELLASVDVPREASAQGGRRAAIVYAVFIFVVRLVATQSGVFSLWFSRRAYERSRGEMITMLYEKTLSRKAFTIPSSSSGDGSQTKDANSGTGVAQPTEDPNAPASTGKILNLMRSDVYEVAQRFWEFSTLVTKPLTFALSLTLIWRFLGPASLLGTLVIGVTQILNAVIARILLRWERNRRAVTDDKLRITTEFVEAIRHLRWYDWQGKWLDRIFSARQRELTYRVIVNLLSKLISETNQMSAYFFPVLAFYAYAVLEHHPLTVDVAFPALSLFSLLSTSLMELPGLITVLLNASVAMGRIEKFMAEADKEDFTDLQDLPQGSPSFEDTSGPSRSIPDLRIEIRDTSFSWPGSSLPILKHVSLVCSPGLTMVYGKVGTGKSALLQAILGELDQEAQGEGFVYVPNEMVGYCAQTPWLQSMSIRENITFSDGYDPVRYRTVLDACNLIPDLRLLEAGDLSSIGENGVGLSGGQKARLALARAVYSRARILLLDDPISALDHHTAESILQKLFSPVATPALSSLMRGRLVVFVTHRVDIVASYANQILEVLPSGTVQQVSRDKLGIGLSDHDKPSTIEAAVSDKDMAVRGSKPDEDGEEREENGDDEDEDRQHDDVTPTEFIEEEFRAQGSVMASVYWRFIRAGKLRYWALLLVLFGASRASQLLHYYFLKVWGEAYHQLQPEWPLKPAVGMVFISNDNIASFGAENWLPDLNLPNPGVDARPWLFWFSIIAVCQVVTSAAIELVVILIIYTAGKGMFEEVMSKVSNATFRFYDVTPVGRLMNRLTSDIGTVDGAVVSQIEMVFWCIIGWISSLAVIAFTTPIFLVITAIMTLSFIIIFNRFLPTSQSLRRLETVSLSPLMSNFGTLVGGLTTVRAFRAQAHFQARNIATTDTFQQMDHFYWSVQAWLSYRFDGLSALSTAALTVTALYSNLSPGTVGFVLASAASFVNFTHMLCRKYGELQMQFVSVERIVELIDLEEEPEGDTQPPVNWPGSSDDIVFENVTARYASHLEPSLKGLSFTIPAGSTVAVTGRTGSGKSTLALTLLAALLPDTEEDRTGGRIRIGDVDLASVDKHILRQRISFVAQDPVLFPGSLRDNLDPFSEHSEEDCDKVLGHILGEEFSLTTRIDGGGKNLSQGQRQLVGLGRAILRRSSVVILDEATASIDRETAANVQSVLRTVLRDSTVITIAHRVEAVADATYALVLDKGRVVRAGPV